jgi:ABC-type arginine transport system ATPase subunit
MMIETRGLRKSFGDHVALGGIDLDVAVGTILALLGPDGADKTTTVQILSTLLPAESCQVRVAGHDVAREPEAVRAAIGVTGQFSAVDNLLTGEENLLLMADLHHLGRREGRKRATELLDRFELTDAARKLPATYSGGMRRGAPHGGADMNYVAPSVLATAVGSGCATTAVSPITDMGEGIIAHFCTIAISRACVLTGQVLGSLIRTLISVGVLIGVALLMGFRPTAAWVAALGLIALFTFSVTWMEVVFGLVGKKTPAGANSLSLIFLLLLVHEQRLCPQGLDARRGPLVRRVPALHVGH